MKDIKKQNNMLSSMTKCLGSHRKLNKIKNIRTKASKKHYSSNRDSSISESYSSLSSDGD